MLMIIRYFVFMFFFTCFTSFAQISVGGRVGVNFASVTANEFTAMDKSKTGINIGAIGSVPMGKTGKLFGIGELVLNQKGGSNNVSVNNSMVYLEFLPMLRYIISIKDNFPLSVFFNAGPYFGIKFGRSFVPAAASETEIKTNTFEFGGGAGGGVMYAVGNSGSIFVEYRHQFALSSLSGTTHERNQLHALSAGYLFHFTAKTQEEVDKGVKNGFE
ncbi:MAG: outer membrane beta-barrel protein [Cytophagales bacterium]|nr:outer membrane beta-barrel protein [Cytophagales bacterium]